MKKLLLFSFLFLLFISCRNSLLNIALKYEGTYKDELDTNTFKNQDETIIFIPMHHLGTEAFYKNVQFKIDSLKKENYYFFYEIINADNVNVKMVKKFRKINRQPLTKVAYKEYIDSLYPNFKYKRAIIDQPSSKDFGLNSENSLNADVGINDIVNYYEKRYGDVILTDCDYKTSVFKNYQKCKEENKVNRTKSYDAFVTFRNAYILKKIIENKHQKLAIIYGKEHLRGVSDSLKKIGFIEEKIKK